MPVCADDGGGGEAFFLSRREREAGQPPGGGGPPSAFGLHGEHDTPVSRLGLTARDESSTFWQYSFAGQRETDSPLNQTHRETSRVICVLPRTGGLPAAQLGAARRLLRPAALPSGPSGGPPPPRPPLPSSSRRKEGGAPRRATSLPLSPSASGRGGGAFGTGSLGVEIPLSFLPAAARLFSSPQPELAELLCQPSPSVRASRRATTPDWTSCPAGGGGGVVSPARQWPGATARTSHTR